MAIVALIGLLVSVVVMAPSASAAAPDAPTISDVTPGDSSVSVEFTEGADGGSSITNYQYQLNSGSWVSFSPAVTSSPVTITGLTNGTAYTIKLRAVNADGPGDPSNASSSVTPRTTPSSPTISDVAPGDSAVTVEFSPGDDGGSSITNYEYQLDDGSWVEFDPAVTGSPVTITGLTNGTAHTIKLRAVNAAGSGDASNASSSVAPRTTPSSPTISDVVPGDSSVTVEFSPGDDGGSSITNYEYQLDDGSWVEFDPAVTGSPVTITGLTNGTAYTIKLRAVNAAGSGGESGGWAPVTPRTTPSAPTNLVAIPGDSSVSVEFTAGDDGGSSITNYEYQLDGGSWVALDPVVTGSPVSIAGLTNGTEYTIKLRAVNVAGEGADSDEVTVTPSSVGVDWTSRSAASTATWSAVTYAGGLFVAVATDGSVMTSEDGVAWTSRTAASAASWSAVAGRPNGTLYVAVATDGSVMSSADGESWTSRTAPSAPWSSIAFRKAGGGWSDLFVAVAADGSVMSSANGVSWTLRTAPSEPWSSVTVRPSTGEFVAVAADGPVMTSADGVSWTSRTAPSAPWSTVRSCDTVFVAVATDGSVMTSADGVSWFLRTAAASNQWNSLACGFGIRVAVSSTGSDRVMTSGGMLRPVSPAVTNTVIGNRQVTLTYSTGSSRVDGSPVATRIEYRLDGTGTWRIASGSPLTITRLTNGRTYTIQFRGVNADGAGVASRPVSFTPGTAPAAPGKAARVSGTSTSVTISWANAQLTNKSGFSITSYTYSVYRVDDGPTATAVTSCTTASLTCTLSGLTHRVRYRITGTALNEIGTSSASRPLFVIP